MKSKVLLVSPKLNPEVAKRVAIQLQENIGLGYLASFLEKKGIVVDIMDLNLSNLTPKEIASRDYSLAGISVHSSDDAREAVLIANQLKREQDNLHVTLGGHYASRQDLEILSSSRSIDSVVRGEGEATLYALYKTLEKNGSLRNVEGLSFQSADSIEKNRDRKPIEDLDTIPFPKRYNLANLLQFSQKSAHILTSRGCPGGCSFCVASLNKGWRVRSPENILAEIKLLHSLGFRNFVFEDDNYLGFGLKGKERAIQVARALKKEDLGIKYQISTRADSLDEGILREFSESGVSKIRVGIESFNQRQLDFYNKRVTPSFVETTMQQIIASGIEPHFSFIVFDPYVSVGELQNSVNQMRRFSGNIHFRYVTSSLNPIEGSVAFEQLLRAGLLEKKGESYSYKFLDPLSEIVWKHTGDFREYMAEAEQGSRAISNRTSVIPEEMDKESALKLRRSGRDIENELTSLWLDVLQYSIDSATLEREYKPRGLPSDIEQKRDSLLRRIHLIDT